MNMVDSLVMLPLLVLSLHKVASVPESVLGLQGNAITLVMKGDESVDPDVAVWNFNHSSDIVRYYPCYNMSRRLRIPGAYKGRVKFDRTNFSLKLKNLMKTDSGLYRGEIYGENGKTVVKYSLSVLELVSAPTLTVESVLSSGDMTVTCVAGELFLTSTCKDRSCTQKKQTASTSLTIFGEEGVITCNHSNSVSWSHHTQSAEFLSGPTVPLLWIRIAVGSLFVAIVTTGVWFWGKQLEKRRRHTPDKLRAYHCEELNTSNKRLRKI